MNPKEEGKKLLGGLRNVVLEKNGKDQMDEQDHQRRSFKKSRRKEDHHQHHQTKEGLDNLRGERKFWELKDEAQERVPWRKNSPSPTEYLPSGRNFINNYDNGISYRYCRSQYPQPYAVQH